MRFFIGFLVGLLLGYGLASALFQQDTGAMNDGRT
jgi:hypothetical protein